MIRIACTNCKTILLIDDAFAGGVCRCQHCGTIQTVPARARDTATAGVSGQPVGGSKALFQNEPRADIPSGTGLDELANVVASSGLSGSGLQSRRLTRPPQTPAARNLTPILIAVGFVILGLLGAIVYLMMRKPAQPTPAANNTANVITPNGSGPTPVDKPNFCGLLIGENSVVYVLDRGSSAREIFRALEDATLKSVASLGPERRFQILFWANGSDDAGYPQSSTTYATKENIDAARQVMDSVAVFGASDIKPALQKAIASNPDVIIIATPKGWDLDDAWAKDVLSMRGNSKVKIDTVSLGSGGESETLKSVAAKSSGQYLQVDEAALRNFAGS
jgi:hypothetical protein